jgi:hypothetical protein
MRAAVSALSARLEQQSEAVAAELAAFQQQQLAKQQQQLEDARAAAASAAEAAGVLRDGLLAVHAALSPHSLASALGLADASQLRLSLGAEGYEAVAGRLLRSTGSGHVAPEDVQAVAARVRELLAHVRRWWWGS